MTGRIPYIPVTSLIMKVKWTIYQPFLKQGSYSQGSLVLTDIITERNFQKIIAKVPLAEMHDFSSSLRSITQGRAKFKMHFDSYQPVSYELQKKLTEEYNKSATEAVA